MPKKCVLWIDDEAQRYDELIARLAQSDIQVDLAYTATEAFDKLRDAGKYDGIIADLILPEGGRPAASENARQREPRPYEGLQVLAQLFDRPESWGKPIIVLSIAEDPDVRRQLTVWHEKRLIANILEKGVLSLDDTVDAVKEALGLTSTRSEEEL